MLHLKKLTLLAGLFVWSLLFLAPDTALAEDAPYKRLEEWQYTIIHQVKVKNPGPGTARDISVTLPLMDTSSHPYHGFVQEQLLPWPQKIQELPNGNREAVYTLPSLAPGEEILLEQRYGISSFGVQYTFNPGQIEDTYTDLPHERYLRPSPGIESDHGEIIAYARQIAGGEENPYRLARKTFADINLFLDYTTGSQGNQGALATLRKGGGICDDYASLFVAVMRALNIPARIQTGYLYLPKDHSELPYTDAARGRINIDLMRHAWPEFYLPEIGWVAADPSFTYAVEIGGVESKFVDWSYFASIPSQRRYLFFREGGDGPDKITHTTASGSCQISFDAFMHFGNHVQPYNDLEEHWAKSDVIYLHRKGLVSGIGAGAYGVNQPITRSQMAVLLNRLGLAEENGLAPAFQDVKPAHWAYMDISRAAAAGLMAGYPNGEFRPQQAITRGEIAVVLVRAFDLKMGNQQFYFKDLNSPGWGFAAHSMAVLASQGLAKGVQPGIYQPQKTLTRGEVAALLARILQKQEQEEERERARQEQIEGPTE